MHAHFILTIQNFITLNIVRLIKVIIHNYNFTFATTLNYFNNDKIR